jgi:hypothetical protein
MGDDDNAGRRPPNAGEVWFGLSARVPATPSLVRFAQSQAP